MRAPALILLLILGLNVSGLFARAKTPTPTPVPTIAVDEEQARLQAQVDDLRLRLHEEGRRQAERARPDWWDLPSRRRQTDRLRRLRYIERELEQRLQALEALKTGK